MSRQYSIRMAAQLSGLTPIVIRAWENRYSAVTPRRNAGNQRQYSDEDVTRLITLARGVEAGFRISSLCSLGNEEIEEILRKKTNLQPQTENYIGLCFKALDDLNHSLLEECLESASRKIGLLQAIDDVIMPFMTRLGEGWNRGEYQIYQEHMASESVKSFLSRKLQSHQPDRKNPVAVVSTPSGQSHDIGASASAVAAALAGYHVLYLGSDTPWEELISAVRHTDAAALILSIVFPGTPGQVRRDLESIRRALPERCRLMLGGSSARAFNKDKSMMESRSLRELRSQLQKLR